MHKNKFQEQIQVAIATWSLEACHSVCQRATNGGKTIGELNVWIKELFYIIDDRDFQWAYINLRGQSDEREYIISVRNFFRSLKEMGFKYGTDFTIESNHSLVMNNRLQDTLKKIANTASQFSTINSYSKENIMFNKILDFLLPLASNDTFGSTKFTEIENSITESSPKNKTLEEFKKDLGEANTISKDVNSQKSFSNDTSNENYAFSKESMERISSKGYQIYQKAEEEKNADLFYKAGEAFDRSFVGFWGDYVFGEVSHADIINNLGVPKNTLNKNDVEELIKEQQKSLVFSCECYVRCLQLDLNHYEANLKLATALTAALQVNAALPYWHKALTLNRARTLEALVADSSSFGYRGVAAKETIKYLKLQPSDIPVWGESLIEFGETIKLMNTQKLPSSYLQNERIASNLFKINTYLINKIQNFENN